MKTPTTYATKTNLLDYVTKSEFNDFKVEMYDFRDEMYNFRNKTEQRFNNVDRRFDELKEEFRLQTGILMDQMREDRKVTLEYIRGLIPQN